MAPAAPARVRPDPRRDTVENGLSSGRGMASSGVASSEPAQPRVPSLLLHRWSKQPEPDPFLSLPLLHEPSPPSPPPPAAVMPPKIRLPRRHPLRPPLSWTARASTPPATAPGARAASPAAAATAPAPTAPWSGPTRRPSAWRPCHGKQGTE
ncbi:hypothetical protein ACP70R_008156 [Stipagrostis hirtigluma subsp. patula]